jgi:hypothetical protein
VKATGDVRIDETRWFVEDGTRLHVAAYSREKKLPAGTKVRFAIERKEY